MWGHETSCTLNFLLERSIKSNPEPKIHKKLNLKFVLFRLYNPATRRNIHTHEPYSTQMSSTFSTPPLPFQHFHGVFHLRKLLLHNPLSPLPSSNAHHPLNPNATGDKSFNINVVVVFIVLMCALFSSLGLNSFVRCALWCSNVNGNSSNRGIKKKALKTFPVVNYSAKDSKLPGLDTECVICISEFVFGDRVRILPKCSHVFHVRCIDMWLSSHSSCPTCRHCLKETCHKIAGVSQASSSEQPPPPIQERVVNIAPLEREGLVSNYRGVS